MHGRFPIIGGKCQGCPQSLRLCVRPEIWWTYLFPKVSPTVFKTYCQYVSPKPQIQVQPLQYFPATQSGDCFMIP